ncbi:transglutaminase family protein [Actinokineospora iranica]|uniref:transglutaminase family protein n=1 Tax=Actinokineospora iranica TaxID=1271860 RepID=UPI000B8934E8|nr:transglutaminase domain-containing protein [Actinokineospora iranica]
MAAVLAAAVVPGLLFQPVFGFRALVAPIAVVVVACFAVTELCARFPRSQPWRPVLATAAGLLGLVELLLRDTTVAGVPTGATVRAIVAGVSESWLLTLRSTWPARPEPDLLLFVPLAVLVAAVAGVELLGTGRRPLPALLPSLAVLGVSQLFGAVTGVAAIVAGVAYAGVAVVLLLATGRAGAPGPVVAAMLPVALVGAVLAGTAQPERTPYSLRDQQHVPQPTRVVNPLSEVASRLRHPDEPVFTYTTSGPVDRWRLLALDKFDGVTWSTDGGQRWLGDALPSPAHATSHTARIEGAAGPWVPSQALPAAVTGPRLLVDEATGALRLPARTGPVSYELRWWEPSVQAGDLIDGAVDQVEARRIGDLGPVPREVADLARTAVGDIRPSAQTALALERFLSENYDLAEGPDIPTGSGWPQLRAFLLKNKVGTSEQFAAAYVVLARFLGIPARLAVGYRAPASSGGPVVVRNRDALVWPEVAIENVGWVPLDPTRAATTGAARGGLAEAADRARAQLPPAADLVAPALRPPPPDATNPDSGFRVPWRTLALAVTGAFLVGVAAVPLLTALRAWRRRRAPGTRAVVGAWFEARDRLRAHGMAVTPGTTVRDVLAAVSDPTVAAGLSDLADILDATLWSPDGADDDAGPRAWAAVGLVRKGLAKTPWPMRLRAAVDPRLVLRRDGWTMARETRMEVAAAPR